MMSSYYTPPPSSGSQWSQPLILPPHRPSSATHQQNAQLLPHATPNNSNQSPYASMMMQQMLQNYTFNVSHQQQQFAQHPQPQQQHVPTPVFDQPEMRTPQPSDNPLLAQVIYEQTKRGLTYKAALESLHGHSGIMAFAWKDYFLENKQTIDALVDNLSRQTPSSSNVYAKQRSSSPVVNNGFRPSPAAERKSQHLRTKSEDQKSQASEERSASVLKKGKSKENTPTRVVTTKKEKEANGKSEHKSSENRGDTPSRRTLNSLSSAPSNDLLAKIPPAVAVDESTGLPAAPSRSPSPPPPGPNSRYTEQDAIFFFRRIAYDLARHPELSKAGLCELLGQKVPHHSALSWRTYWHRHEDVADKMYLLTQLDEADREAAIQSWKGTTSVKAVNPRSRAAAAARRISYKESSDSESGEASNSGSSSSKSEDESSDTYDEEDDSDAQGSTDEEGQLGEAGSVFSIVEKRVLAKHIASSPEWFNGRREWESFFAAYPQRTQASWREYYRRKGNEIDALAKKYMRKAKKASRTSISAQRGRPSWARRNPSAAAIDGTGPIKRKLVEGDSREQSEEKRTKMEEDI